MAVGEEVLYGYLKLTNIHFSEWHATITNECKQIGRGHDAEIITPREYTSISRIHAKIWGDRRGCWIEDVGSSHGTFVNGIPLVSSQPARMECGDKITLSDIEFQLLPIDSPMVEIDKPLANSTIGTMMHRTVDAETEPALDVVEELSPAEMEIIMQMRRGVVDHEDLGKELHRSPHTIRKQLESVYRKFGVHSRHELMAKILTNK